MRFISTNTLVRFAKKCAFDPITGCVMWTAGTSSGHGHNEPYGRFRDAGFSWYAHRWAAHFIHGFDITGLQVDHNCPAGPSTLCVQHVQPQTAEVNRYLQHLRPGRAFQDLTTKRYWCFVSKGLEEFQPAERANIGVPCCNPPMWLQPYLPHWENFNAAPF